AEAAKEQMLAQIAAENEQKRRAEEAARRNAARDAAKKVEVIEDEPIKQRPRPGDPTGKDDANIEKGNAEYKRGMDLVDEGRSTSSGKKSTQCYKDAVNAFTKAMGHYQKAAQADPNNKSLEDRMQQCNMQLYWARKMQRL
ncbi:MAG: hypothetical protein JXR97_11380, partial [Planctomycetes bacterium]|nr:hypothetical protein [Planctomycetota bacterium]